MLNESTLNASTLWSGSVPTAASLDDVSINNFWLQNEYIITSNIEDDTITDVSSYNNPQIHGRWFLSNFKRWRNISMQVTIKWDSQLDFLERLDNFRKEIYTEESELSWLRQDGEYRKIKVNCTSNPKIFNSYNLTFLTLDLTFESLEPFWYKESYQSKNITWKTASFTEEITNEWKAVSDVQFYVIVNSWSLTETSIAIWDTEITITDTISAWDILYINWEEKTVDINGTEIDYSWVFPTMSSSTNFFDYILTWTFEIDTIILNRKNYV